MNHELIYNYPPLISGILIKRYKRFFADIELATGEVITAHCANTGSMIGVCEVGSVVLVSQSDNPKRKLAYSWEAIQVNNPEPTWVGINTGLPNKVIKLALQKKIFPELSHLYDRDRIRHEVPYGIDNKSRIDFLLTKESSNLPVYLEVKNVTLAENNVALFPDTVTTRGQKHLRELIALVPVAKPVMLFFINRDDCYYFSPGDRYDPEYGKLLRKAIEAGVTILSCRFQVTPEGIYYLGLAKFVFS
jgi:sugar fermentation stimulation protein A